MSSFFHRGPKVIRVRLSWPARYFVPDALRGYYMLDNSPRGLELAFDEVAECVDSNE